MLEVYSSVHSNTFPAISYIFCFLVASDAPVVNNIAFEFDEAFNFVLTPSATLTQFSKDDV